MDKNKNQTYQDLSKTFTPLLYKVNNSFKNAKDPVKKVILNLIYSINISIEFMKIAQSCALGFAVMGVVGYVIKLVFIPINNIILT